MCMCLLPVLPEFDSNYNNFLIIIFNDTAIACENIVFPVSLRQKAQVFTTVSL